MLRHRSLDCADWNCVSPEATGDETRRDNVIVVRTHPYEKSDKNRLSSTVFPYKDVSGGEYGNKFRVGIEFESSCHSC